MSLVLSNLDRVVHLS